MTTTKAKASNKEHIATADGREPIRDEDGRLDFTKSGRAFQIFDQMHEKDNNVARKDCVARAIEEADMTPASAATFYQNWRSERGLVHRTDDDDNHSNTAAKDVRPAPAKKAAAKHAPAGNKPGMKGNTAAKK